MLPSKKSPHYHNILELDSTGCPLATVSSKRANWYLQRGLAISVPAPDGYPECIQLTFPTKGKPTADKAYQVRRNICVVCGADESLTLHHIIPRVISRKFPLEEKGYQSKFCVLLCQVHHQAAERLIFPLLAGSVLWKKCQSPVKVVGCKSASTILALHRTKKLTSLKQTHPERVQLLCSQAGLISLPQTQAEWRRLEKKQQQKVTTPTKKDFAQQYITDNGGIESIRQLFWQTFLQLHPQLI